MGALGDAVEDTTEELSDYEKALNKARDAVIDEREESDDAIQIQNDLAASFGALEEHSDTLAPSIDELAEAMQQAAEEAENATDWIDELNIRLLDARQDNDLFTLSLGRIRTGFKDVDAGVPKLLLKKLQRKQRRRLRRPRPIERGNGNGRNGITRSCSKKLSKFRQEAEKFQQEAVDAEADYAETHSADCRGSGRIWHTD